VPINIFQNLTAKLLSENSSSIFRDSKQQYRSGKEMEIFAALEIKSLEGRR